MFGPLGVGNYARRLFFLSKKIIAMKNFVQDGCVVDVPISATIAAGDGVLIGAAAFGVATKGGVSGDTIAVAVVGVFELPKETGANGVIAIGGAVYWDNTNKRLTATTSGNTLIGWAVKAMASGDTTGTVKIRF